MKVISLEGIAGAGKSTAASVIKQYLEKKGLYVLIHKPIRRVTFSQITKVFGDPNINVWTMQLPTIDYKVELFCFWSILMNENLKVSNSNYDVIIIDRYIDTVMGLCYSKALMRGSNVKFDEYYKFVVNYLYPQVIIPETTFLFDVKFEEASNRTLHREMRPYNAEDIEMFNTIYNFNKETSQKEIQRFKHINSNVPIAEVFEQIEPYL